MSFQLSSGNLIKQLIMFAALIMYVASGFGITGGAHRLWTHKSYKATLPLKLFLLLCFSSAGQVNKA